MVEVRWDNPGNADITGYQFRLKLASANEWGYWWDALRVDATTTNLKLGFLERGADYQLQLRAVDDGTPGLSSDVSFTAP